MVRVRPRLTCSLFITAPLGRHYFSTRLHALFVELLELTTFHSATHTKRSSDIVYSLIYSGCVCASHQS